MESLYYFIKGRLIYLEHLGNLAEEHNDIERIRAVNLASAELNLIIKYIVKMEDKKNDFK